MEKKHIYYKVTKGYLMTDEDQLAVWCPSEEWCAIYATSKIMGKKWHPAILHRLINQGPLRFNELKDAVGGISSKVLTESLEDLEDNGVVTRTVIDDRPVQVEYDVTDLGASFEPVIDAMEEWGATYLKPAEQKRR